MLDLVEIDFIMDVNYYCAAFQRTKIPKAGLWFDENWILEKSMQLFIGQYTRKNAWTILTLNSLTDLLSPLAS